MSTPELRLPVPELEGDGSEQGITRRGIVNKLFSAFVRQLPEDTTPEEILNTELAIDRELGCRGEHI